MPSLVETLRGLPPAFEIGFAQSPTWSGFVRCQSVGLRSHAGVVDLTWVFDLRLFTAGAEFHWWWDQQLGDGRDFTLSDDSARARDWSVWEGGSRVRRILRGKVIATDDGWSRIHDGHSQPLWVPVEEPKDADLSIGAVEYTATDAHGNVGVVAERFTTIEREAS